MFLTNYSLKNNYITSNIYDDYSLRNLPFTCKAKIQPKTN